VTSRSRSFVSSAVAALAGALAVAQAPVALSQSQGASPEAAKVAQLMKDLGLHESDTAVRSRKDWRVPKKIVMIGGDPGTRQAREDFTKIAPGAEVVAVSDFNSAVAAMSNADIIVGITSYPGVCEREITQVAKELRYVMSMSAGVERCTSNPDITGKGILVTNLRAVDSATIGEHAIALALALARGFDKFIVDTKQGQWRRGGGVRMQTLVGKTMLVVGLGGIGTEVASRAHGLGMKVTATRNSGRTGPDYVSYVGLPDELLKLAKDADVIVNTAPLTTETTGIFNEKFFATMKPTAYFINVARGGSVVTADLQKALVDGRIAGAGLDVVEPEPLPPDNPLWKAPNLIITPHTSSRADVQGEGRWLLARENLRRYVAGGKMLSEVDLKKEY
jgi:phosphoglycerate dehydrogenase-like enzyme